jgi:AAA family ATP:ADP antiporter
VLSPRRSELAIVAWGALTFAALLASFSAFRPVRDALVLDGNPDDIPWLFTTTFVAVGVASPAWSALLARRSKRRIVPVAFHVFAICALVFAWLVHEALEPRTVGRVFYVWASVFNLFVVSVFWSLLADLLGPSTARRLYGPIAAGGTVGAFVGPLLTKLLLSTIGVGGVLVMSAVLLELAVIGTWRVRLAGEQLAPEIVVETPTRGGALTGIREVARSPYLSAIVGYVLCTACAATFMYLEQAGIVHASLGDRLARADYFASIELWTAGATLVVQLVLAGPLITWLGPGLVLLVLPLAQAIGISALALAPSLTVLAVAQVVSRTATHGLTRPARELLFTVIDRDAKYHAKNAIDTIAYRLGDFGSSWLHQGLIAIGAGSAAVAIAALPLVIGWVSLAVILGAGFRRRATSLQEST